MFSLFRVIKFAFQDFFRNFSLSLMTIVMLVLMLLSTNSLIMVRALTDKAISKVKDQIDVSIYFRPEATEAQIAEVQDHLKAFPEVKNSTYLNQDQVLAKFKETHKGNDQIISSLQELGQNPLGPTLILKTRDPKDYEKIITALNVPEYEKVIEAKTFASTEGTIDQIHSITTNVQRFVLVLGGLFGLISFLVIFNTIRVGIYTHRMEIAIKKLVGATNWFISGPYYIQAFMFSVFAVAIASGIIHFSARFIDPYIAVVFGEMHFLTNYFFSNILMLFGIQFLVVFVLSFLTTHIAMRKYLKV